MLLKHQRTRLRAVVAATTLGLVAAPFALAAPASANPGGTGLVISEVYGGGGNTGAAYTNDFVELYNPTDAPISVNGMSVQYRNATGTSAQVTSLTGSVPAKGHYLVQQAAGTTVTDKALPTPDATGNIAMSGSAGVVLLVPSTAAFTEVGDFAGDARLIDMVGYGTTPTSFETVNTGVALTNSTAATRTATGADSDHNANDFSELAPAPQNAASTDGGTDPDTEPPVTPPLKSIAEIQGTDRAASSYVGQTVTTKGVVTADYDTGGYNGFYIQTPGTGSGTDTTPNASDAIFVFGSAAAAKVSRGDYVQVTAPVAEYQTSTQLTPASATDVTVLSEAVQAPVALSTSLPATDAEKEAHEGELLAPSGPFTVTNSYATGQYGEVGLAAGTRPLIQPTEVEDAQTGNAAAITADNAARAITLDDGASANYASGAKNSPMSWLSPTNPIRVGAAVQFTGPVVLEYRNNIWKLQPTTQVTGEGKSTAVFENTRTDLPTAVGGDIKLATFNVLNYFPTTGAEYVAAGLGTCTYYNDREGNPITVNSCTNNGPRGAANEQNLARQQAKIVRAINKLDASIVSLEELENSVKFGKSRDFAISRLVDALNADAGAGTWAFAPSPNAADMPTPAEEDVIRTGFIYKPAAVTLVGASKILRDEVNFDNAREPLAQAFQRADAPRSEPFAVIVNHFKSKGSGFDDGTGQGNANPDRIGQAEALAAFAGAFKAERDLSRVFLAGDFNAYSQEDPMQVLYKAGYKAIESDTEGEETYSYQGLSGSLDHVLANEAALPMVTGADVWNINSVEAVAYEYSRYNYNATNLYAADQFKASDHDPEIVGLDSTVAELEEIQVLGTNDFHGRLLNNSSGTEAGAAVMSGAVKQLRAAKPNTVFAAAGDLIGASTFESFIANDKPTIDALNEAGLEVSAVGNHEFDQGYDDLLKRVMAPYDAETNPQGGARWEYIGANVHKPGAPESELLEPTWVKDFGDVEVGFVGAVTEHLDELVSPAGIAGVEIEDIVTATNREADALKAAGVEVVVLLVHEGAPTTAVASATAPDTDFGDIVNGVNANVDAIVSGHTHLAYNHAITVPDWVSQGRDVTTRPVVSAGQYGAKLNQLLFTVDENTGEVVAKSQAVLDLKTGQTPNYPVDAPTKSIVDAADAQAKVLGAKELGKLAGPFNRAKLGNGTSENRGGESTAGNLVAEVQRWATDASHGAEIAFMNPGGLRADMIGTGTDYPRVLTYKQAAEMQPFANTLVNMRLTGAQIKNVLEEQWQPSGTSRPFLKLGVSKGFEYTYDPSAAKGSRITKMWLNGAEIEPLATYSVTVNSFLASGGDNFSTLNAGTQKRDTGKVDLQAMVDYMAQFAGTEPLKADTKQRAVGVTFPAGAPAAYAPGDTVEFSLSSLAFSTAADVKDAEVTVKVGSTTLGTFAVDNTVGAATDDEIGKAAVKVNLPVDAQEGKTVLTVTGTTTGTTVPVTVTVERNASSVSATAQPMTYGTDGTVDVTVTSRGPVTGQVEVVSGTTVLGTGTLGEGGQVAVTIGAKALEPGSHALTVRYLGDETTLPSSGEVTLEVVKATPVVTGTLTTSTVKVKKDATTVNVRVTADGFTPSGGFEVLVDNVVVTSGTLTNGEASAVIGPFDTVGAKSVVVRYLGDAHAASGTSATQTLTVQKGTPHRGGGARWEM